MTDDLRRRMHDQQVIGWLRRIDAKLAGLDIRLQILAEICDRMTGWGPLKPCHDPECDALEAEEILSADGHSDQRENPNAA